MLTHPLEAIVAVLDVFWELYGGPFTIIYGSDHHVCTAAKRSAEMVFRVEIARHPAAAVVEDDDRTQDIAGMVFRRLVDADGYMLRDPFVVCILRISCCFHEDLWSSGSPYMLSRRAEVQGRSLRC